MSSPSNLTQRTTTGDIVAGETVFVRSVVLTAGSDAATVVLRAGGSGGTVIATLSAATGTSRSANLHEAQCTGGLHVTLSGTGASVSVAWV